MNNLKPAWLTLLFLCNVTAAGNIEFSTEISSGQTEESVTLTFDTGEICKLHVKNNLFGFSTVDSCQFQPSQRVHQFSITGEVRQENYDETGTETFAGVGSGFIVSLEQEVAQLNNAKNIGQLSMVYSDTVTALNKSLPADEQIPQLTFSDKETIEHIHAYQSQYDITLPIVYINMLTQYGYPKYFLPLEEQKSIADIYMNEYGYSKEQFNYHAGIEKNKVFFRENEDVAYVFHDSTKTACNNEPIVDYTIITEGDYTGFTAHEVTPENCGQFFSFLKEQFVEHFLTHVFHETGILPAYKDKVLEASLSYNWPENDSEPLEYYFNYNDIFY